MGDPASIATLLCRVESLMGSNFDIEPVSPVGGDQLFAQGGHLPAILGDLADQTLRFKTAVNFSSSEPDGIAVPPNEVELRRHVLPLPIRQST